ncbi:nuclear protein MDM1 isoform X2 [Onthophagus taurus]|uniref:nuclear protein MDM1 isoform X2 n=1 Tax=Onthophagus taurus TaxID=166361 RepID=UPI000C1FF501|nr:nuclear protein MDM1 isoform X1 [Onthophagus taurus]
MIGSFWNLCRACPSMPVDKLHSEYRSTYRWHEYTGPRQEVIRRAPTTQPGVGANSDEKPNEPPNTTRIDEETQNELPKLEPALPRRKKHPDLAYRHHEFLVSDGTNGDAIDVGTTDRARSTERESSQWKPSRRSKSEGPARSTTLTRSERRRDSDPDLENTGRDQGLLQKAISKISTEYRLQFAWPQGHMSRRDQETTPRKSQSMNAIKPPANAVIHKRRGDLENKDASELEPLVNDNTIHEYHETAKDFNTEYKKKYRPFSQYDYAEGKFKSKQEVHDLDDETKNALLNGPTKESWYKEVVELRKKAGEYRTRGRGTDITGDKITDVYNKQVELWDQVSRRSSLSALSLASTTHRAYTKEEKDQENTKKSSPTKALRNAENSARMVRDMIRHHLERTTGGSEFDGLILSPTREKLEPTIPRKDDDIRGSQKNSPKKNSPQKVSLQKKSKSKSVPRTVRSQSVGPVEVNYEKRSPKRQSRSATVKEKKSSSSSTTRRPRPSSLNTTSRSKSRPVPSQSEDDRSGKTKSNKAQSSQRDAADGSEAEPAPTVDRAEKEEEEAVEPEPEPEVISLEPVVKSPPEPTRVKSPEQIIMRSPDPVNWTVPLDTGKTFTVTQNVREGDISARPQSEVKAWTPPEIPPPVAQSAPPELQQQKDQARRGGNDDPSNVEPVETGAEEIERPIIERPDEGSSLDCPQRESSSTAKTVNPLAESKSFASDVLEKARNRFDNFWRKNSKDEST